MALTRDRIFSEVKRLISELEEHQIKIKKSILFGSYANGSPTDASDVDIAIVSDNFQGVRFLDKKLINPILIHYDSRLEVHPYRTDEFNEDERWFVREILRTGIEIT